MHEKQKQAVPFLLSHLAQPYSSPIREGIARALGAPAALREWTVLVTRYELERDARVKDGIAAALSAIADDTVINSLIALVLAPANGPSRLLLLRALAKSRDPKARDAMLKLRGDPLFEDELKALSRHSK